MRTIRIKLYKFSELSKDAQEIAIDNFRNNNDCSYVWEDMQRDAEDINLNLISLDDHRPNKGHFIGSAMETALKIFSNHGESCETYKTALNYLKEFEYINDKAKDTWNDEFKGENELSANEIPTIEEWTEDNFEEDFEEAEKDFLHSLLEDYRIMLNKEYDYQNSDAAITETIEANEYEFTKDGKLS